MSFLLFLVLAFVGSAILGFLLVRTARAALTYNKYRGKRLVTCPETHCPAAVDVDAGLAGRAAFDGEPRLRLSTCSRWPERQGCGQECLAEIEAAPEDCLVRRIVTSWYEGKKCALCSRPIVEAKEWWVGHPPALMSVGKEPVAWEDIPPELLPDAFLTSEPVCWNCLVTESFRHKFPELVTDRKDTPLRKRF